VVNSYVFFAPYLQPIFKDNRMIMKKTEVPDPNATVIFRDGSALMDFLFSNSGDIVGSILDNKLRYEGNVNYIFKFSHMALKLKKELL